ncbi:dihydrodipicolinate synthase family protein [Neorhizobium galegae]|uniref:dihydrodipicolinate synthase family protein n=1 Tax=Neorhizobium galegae TaxID=399 RepID=UPI001F3FC73C|nr:dihydrodipicolinate synthase family protein [Neorhizobium galegae]UIK03494.1 dihydrodipicolinate synthase family protein [Neorhizobium galegae]
MTPFHTAPRQAYTPLLTPFSENGIDFQALESAVDRQIVGGMDGIIVCDAVGEGFALSQGERDAILWSCVTRAKPHLSIIAAAGTNCTRTTIEQSHRAAELGADALLITVPYYSKPPLKGVIDHFRQISAAVSIPILIDDDPREACVCPVRSEREPRAGRGITYDFHISFRGGHMEMHMSSVPDYQVRTVARSNEELEMPEAGNVTDSGEPLQRSASSESVGPRFMIKSGPRGAWIVNDRLGLVGGIFVSEAAARHFAFEESGGRKDQIALESALQMEVLQAA